MKIALLTTDHILQINQQICLRENQASQCLDKGKIESALGAAYYPGIYPFQYGGIAKVAGAMCYFLLKAHAFLDGNKRTAGLASNVFMDLNGFGLQYAFEKDWNALADIIEKAAMSMITKETVIEWYDQHKTNHENS